MFITITHLVFDQPSFMGWFISPYYSSYFITGLIYFLTRKSGFDYFKITVLLLSLAVSSVKGFEPTNGFLINPDVCEKSVAVIIIWSFYLLFLLIYYGRLNSRNSRTLLYMGGMTYPLYLLHCRIGQAIIDKGMVFMSEGAIVAFTIILVLSLSLAVHIYFEGKVASPLKAVLIKLLTNAKEK